MTDDPHVKRPRAIYLLPNLFTTAALLSGFFAIASAMNGRFDHAAMAIFLAMILDGLDGRVARLVHGESEFGAQYDSLSDMVAFGVAPALVALSWSLSSIGKFGWMASFIFVACAALRLARFNTQIGVVDKKYFVGLSSPTAAALIAGMVWVSTEYGFEPETLAIPAAFLVAIAGVLMVSHFKYKSFKDIDFKGRIPFVALLAIIFGFAIILVDPPLILFLMALTYAVSGPLMSLRIVRQKLKL